MKNLEFHNTYKKPYQPYQMKYPDESHYNIPAKKCNSSPCMMKYWTDQPIRTGKKIIDTEHDKIEEIENEEITDD